jgi:hypothetical protein
MSIEKRPANTDGLLALCVYLMAMKPRYGQRLLMAKYDKPRHGCPILNRLPASGLAVDCRDWPVAYPHN